MGAGCAGSRWRGLWVSGLAMAGALGSGYAGSRRRVSGLWVSGVAGRFDVDKKRTNLS